MLSELYPLAWTSYLDITAVFLRLLGLFLLAPAFNHRSIPAVIKIVVALSFSLALYPVVKPYLSPFPEELGSIVAFAVRESVIGFLMGFAAHVTVEAIHVAAQFIGFQMGFGVGGLMDPQIQSSVTVMVPLYGWVVLMIFFVTNLHHDLIAVFVQSFRITQGIESRFLQNPDLMKMVVALFGQLFVVAVKMAAPFILLILASNAAVGLLNRLMPQMNVLLFSFPITILLGFVAFYLVAPEIITFIENLLGNVTDQTVAILKTL